MVRLLGVDLPRNKRIEYALTYIHGIGLTTAKQIVANAEIDPARRTDDLSTDETVALRTNLELLDLKLEGDLRRFISQNVERLTEIGSAAGRRHRVGLPVRGQRTRTNARTRKGKVKIPVAKKK